MTKPLLACPDDSAEIRALADKCLELISYSVRVRNRLTDLTVINELECFRCEFSELVDKRLEGILRLQRATLESDGPSYESVQPVETELGELERRKKRADEMMARLEAVGKAT